MREHERKNDHLRIVLEEEVGASRGTGLDRIGLEHRALPELSFGEIDPGVSWFEHGLKLPVLISSMTGGGGNATTEMNRLLARAAARHGLAMGVGSQRPLLEAGFPKDILRTFDVVREENPGGWIAANIGGQQLLGIRDEQVQQLVDSISANALFVHLNPVQELIQPEGDREFRGIAERIAGLRGFPVPVFIKETGCGLSLSDLELIAGKLDFAHVDVGGLGGTHWGLIEGLRARGADEQTLELGMRFRSWGIPTADSILHARSLLRDRRIIGSGGIKTGQDVVKVLCLGANLAGCALLFARAAAQGEAKLEEQVELLSREIRMTMLLVGARRVSELGVRCFQRKPVYPWTGSIAAEGAGRE